MNKKQHKAESRGYRARSMAQGARARSMCHQMVEGLDGERVGKIQLYQRRPFEDVDLLASVSLLPIVFNEKTSCFVV